MSKNQVVVAQKPADLMAYMDKAKHQLALALPKHIGADRMVRLAVTAWSQSKALQECSMQSVFGATLQAAQLGLEIGIGGQGYLIPYKGTATFVPGWQGIVDLVSRAGRATVWTGAVYKGDFFDWQLGDSPFIKHKPDSDSDSWDDLEYVYAVGHINGADSKVMEVWSKDRIIRHLNKFNKVGGAHYALKDGYKNFEMYARKVPLLQVMKYMPKSIEVQRAIDAAAAVDTGRNFTIDGDFVIVQNDDQGEDPAVDQRQQEQAGAEAAHGVRSKSQAQQKSQADQYQEMQDASTTSHAEKVTPLDIADDRKATAEELAHLRAKIDMVGIAEKEVEKKFDIDLDALTAGNYQIVLAWVKEQV